MNITGRVRAHVALRCVVCLSIVCGLTVTSGCSDSPSEKVVAPEVKAKRFDKLEKAKTATPTPTP